MGLENISEFMPLVESAKEIAIDRAADRETMWKLKLKEIASAKSERKALNDKLRQHGYCWRKVESLDVAQGEMEQFEWELWQNERFIGKGDSAAKKALREIDK